MPSKETLNYAPFDGDDRCARTPSWSLPCTSPISVTNSQARAQIDRYVACGHSSHSSQGSTLWVLLTWLQHHKMPYRLSADPYTGYLVERCKP